MTPTPATATVAPGNDTVRDSGWINRLATPRLEREVYQDLKFALHRRLTIAGAVIGQLIGYLFIRKIVDFEI